MTVEVQGSRGRRSWENTGRCRAGPCSPPPPLWLLLLSLWLAPCQLLLTEPLGLCPGCLCLSLSVSTPCEFLHT